jgi:chorismate dehydratase
VSSENTKNQNQPARIHRIGAISFFNTRPLIYQLEAHPQIELTRVVPAQLAHAINTNTVDTGLVPSIDYQRNGNDWLILPIAAIVSNGPVLTVRIFSRRPIEKIQSLACDPDSHTSVILAQIIWQLKFHRSLDTNPLPSKFDSADAVLLIGDKVIPQLDRWPYQFDLGQAWTELTRLPFVYAFWAVAAQAKHICEPLVKILRQAYQQGTANLDTVIDRYAGEHGFDKKLARQYFAENVHFDFGPKERQGLKKFYELAHQFKLVPNLRSLKLHPFADIPGSLTH